MFPIRQQPTRLLFLPLFWNNIMCFESIHHCFRCTVAKSQVFNMFSITHICLPRIHWQRKPVTVKEKSIFETSWAANLGKSQPLYFFLLPLARYSFLLMLRKSIRYFWKAEKQASPYQTCSLQRTHAIHTSRQEAKREGLPVSPGLWRSESGSCDALLRWKTLTFSRVGSQSVWEATPWKHTLRVGKLRDIQR